MANVHGTSDPDRWWHGGVFYQIYPRSYADSNGDGIGDLPGIIRSWTTWPAWASPGSGSRPSPARPTVTGATTSRTIATSTPPTARSTTSTRWCARARRGASASSWTWCPTTPATSTPGSSTRRRGRDSAHRDYYVWADPKPDGSPPNNWVSIFGGPAWELDEASGQFYLHNFEAQQPDLNWWSDDVRREFDDIVRFWWDRGVAGFRIDVCNMMIKDKELRDNPPATEDDPIEQQFMGVRYVYNSDRPEAHDILRHWRTIADTYEPQRLLIGETNVETLERLSLFYGGGRDELHGGFNFQFMHAPLEAAKMREVVEGTEALLPDGVVADLARLEPRLLPPDHPLGRGRPGQGQGGAADPAHLARDAVPLRRRRDRPARRRRAEGPPARPGGRPLLPLRRARQRAHADGVEQRAQRRLQCAGRADVAAHDRSGGLQRGRPGGRPDVGARDLPALHRGAHGLGRPGHRLLHVAALARGHLGLPAGCGHDGAAQHVGRLRRRSRTCGARCWWPPITPSTASRSRARWSCRRGAARWWRAHRDVGGRGTGPPALPALHHPGPRAHGAVAGAGPPAGRTG